MRVAFTVKRRVSMPARCALRRAFQHDDRRRQFTFSGASRVSRSARFVPSDLILNALRDDCPFVECCRTIRRGEGGEVCSGRLGDLTDAWPPVLVTAAAGPTQEAKR